MFRSCLQHCWYSCRVWPLIECRCGAVMSSGSGTGYPVMNRELRCAQTGRSEGERGMEEAETSGENKSILLFQGRRGVFFFFFFFSLQVQSVVRAQLRVLSGAASSAQDPSAGSLGGLGVKVCLHFPSWKKEKQLRELLWGGHHKSQKF